MSQQNINNAGAARKSIQATNSQVTHIQGPEKVAENKPAFKPDFSEAPKGPAVPSDRNHLVSPESSEDQAMRNRAVNLNFEFRDDDYDSISFDLKNDSQSEGVNSSFALAENDHMSILVDRNPSAETHNIIESTLLDANEMTDLNFDLGYSAEDIT
jgi:hypothetical protein